MENKIIYKGPITKEEFDELFRNLYKNDKKFKKAINMLQWIDDWLSMQSAEFQKEFSEATIKMIKND